MRAPFIIDTSYGGHVAFFSVFVANHNLLVDRDVIKILANTVCGPTTDLSGVLKGFELGKVTLDSLMVSFMQPGSAADAGAGRLGGFIGRGLLSRYRPVFDFGHQRIALVTQGAEAAQTD